MTEAVGVASIVLTLSVLWAGQLAVEFFDNFFYIISEISCTTRVNKLSYTHVRSYFIQYVELGVILCYI